MSIWNKIQGVWETLQLREVRLRAGLCPLCGRTLFVKIGATEWAVRCLRCRGNVVTFAVVAALKQLVGTLGDKRVYELSSRGSLFRYLQRRAGDFTFSDYFDDVPPGAYKGAIQCQDVHQLTFADESFDLCTCTEVFEHVPDDRQGMSEVCRVLKSDGLFLFTVPLADSPSTLERATVRDGSVVHLQPPEYHNDYLRGRRSILCFRTYGRDIVDRLREAGFAEARVVAPADPTDWGYRRPVVVAFKTAPGAALL